MNRMLYGAMSNVELATVETAEHAPQESTLEASVKTKDRELIALVGRNGTGKHTYLEEYYQNMGVDKYLPLSSIRCVEQNGIHPHDQGVYIETLRSSVALPLPDRFMFVTHSPYILDAMGWDQVHNIIFFHKSGGKYYRGTLLSYPQYELDWAKENLSPGEFWDEEGESWLEKYGEDVTCL